MQLPTHRFDGLIISTARPGFLTSSEAPALLDQCFSRLQYGSAAFCLGLRMVTLLFLLGERVFPLSFEFSVSDVVCAPGERGVARLPPDIRSGI